MKNNIFYNQKDFIEYLETKSKKNEVIMLDESFREIKSGMSKHALIINEILKEQYLKLKQNRKLRCLI